MSTELQQLNGQTKMALWVERISACRSSGLTVKRWCKENGVGEQTYYKWQRRVFAMVMEQQEAQFAEITPIMGTRETASVAINVHVGDVAADIHNGADSATVEAVLRILKLC